MNEQATNVIDNDEVLFNTADVTDTYEALPSGGYNMTVHSVEMKKASTGGRMIALSFEVADELHNGRLVFTNYNIGHSEQETVDIAQSNLKSLVTNCGLGEDGDFDVTWGLIQSCKDQPLVVVIGQEGEATDEYGIQNTVRRFRPEGSPIKAIASKSRTDSMFA
jgi:hypothetical protein